MACIRYCNFGFKRLKHTKKTVWVHKTVLWLRNNSFEHLNNTLLTVGKSEKDQNLLWFTCFSDLVDDQICRFARFPFATSRSAKVIYKFFFTTKKQFFEYSNNTLLTVGKSEKDQNLLWFTCFSDLVDDQICRFARFPFATSRSAKIIYNHASTPWSQK